MISPPLDLQDKEAFLLTNSDGYRVLDAIVQANLDLEQMSFDELQNLLDISKLCNRKT